MEDLPHWKALAKALVLPPVAPLLFALIGLGLMRRHPRRGRALVSIGVGILVLLSMPAVSTLLLRVVDQTPVLDPAQAATAQAIVILGGGIRRQAPEYGGATLAPLTLERVRYGARVARATHLPVLVSGGRFAAADPTEAAVMKAALEDEFRVPVRWVEDRSRNTHENAQMSAALLTADGVTRVVLIGHSFDMPRATAEFAAAGIATVPAPTGIVDSSIDFRATDFVPTAAGLQQSYYALYELYAEAWRRLTG